MAIEGKWQLKFNSSMGEQTPTLTLNADGSGTFEMAMGSTDFTGATVDGDTADITVTMDGMGQSMTLQFTAKADGDTLSGELNIPGRDSRPISGERIT